MPNKRNGVFKGRPKRGLYLEEDFVSEIEVSGGMASSVSEENFKFLLDIFPNVDTEIIQAVLLEYNGSLNECIEKLSEISGEQSNQTMEEMSNDLAIIACSLLTEESQPMGITSLDISDAPEGLGSASLSNNIVQDQQNLESSMRDFSSLAHVEESPGDAVKHLNPSMLLRNGIVKDAAISVNNNTSWLKKQDYRELNNCESYNIYGNENNKVLKPKPDFLNSSTGSNNFIEEAGDSKLRKELVSDLSWFPNVAKSATNSSEAHIINAGSNIRTDNGERSVLYENSHHQEINSSTAGIHTQGNLDKKLYKTDRRRLQEVNGTSDFTTAGNLNSSDNPLFNSWANVLSEWDKFYSHIGSDGFSTYCDSIKLTDAGGSERNKNSASPAVAENTSQLHGGSVGSEYDINTGLLKMNKSQRNRDLKQKNSSAKAAAFVGHNYTFQSSDAVPTSLGATNSTGLASSGLAASFSSSAQSISMPLGGTDSTDLPSCNLTTHFSSSAKSIGSSYSTVSREDRENSKKETSSKLKLSPSALEFIPRSVAIHLARPVSQVAASSRNQKPDEAEDVQFFSAPSTRKKKNATAKKGKHKKLHEDTGSLSYGDKYNFQMPVRLGDCSSYLRDTKQDSGVKSQKNVDPMDPLGWSDIFSESTSSLIDPKPQRTRKARKLSVEKSMPDPSFSPWQIPSESQQNGPRSSPPMMKKHQELPDESFPASFDAVGASTSHPMYKKSQNGTSSAISATQTVSNSPIAARLPPSLTNTAGPAAAVVNSVVDNANMSSSSPTPKKMLSESDVRSQGSTAACTQSQLLENKLQFRGVKTPVGVIRHYIHEKQSVMIILRGLPGSGKSYLAKQLLEESQRIGAQGEVLSTDDFFVGVGQYSYNRNDLPDAHDWNKKRALQCVKERRSPVIIDNTNTTMWELLPYAVLALQHGYDIQMFEPDTPWRLKVMELARKNIHGVRKENIKRMKERWEHFTLDDVIKQASYSIASRKMPTAGPVNSPSVAPSSAGQHHPAVNNQMTTLEQTNVTGVSHQNSSSSIPNSPLQELGLSDWFDAQKPRPPQKMKQKVNLAWSPWKSPKCENAQEGLNQSPKKTMVNALSMSPSQAAESPCNHSFSQNASLAEIHSSHSSHMLSSSTVVATERQLSDDSWNSDSETPTVDKDMHLFGKTSTDRVNMLQGIQKEAVTVSTGFPGEIRENEEAFPGSVLNRSLSTSGSFHTVHSNSNISSYDTVDGDEDNVRLSADIISDEDSGNTLSPEHDVQMLLKERDVDELHAAIIDAEALPVHLEKMSLFRDEASSFDYVPHGCEEFAISNENQDLEITSSAVEPLKNSSKTQSGIVSGIPAGSSPEESFTAADLGLSTVSAPSAEDIDTKKNCLDSLTHNVRNSCCLTDISLTSLVDYSDSDDDSSEECSGDAAICKGLSQLCIGNHASGQVDICCSLASNGGKTSDVPDGFNCSQVGGSSGVKVEQSTDIDIGLAQDTEIRAVQDTDIYVGGSFEDREISADGLVSEREICSDGLFQHRGKTISMLIHDKEISLGESVEEAEISSVALVQDREISVDRSVEDRESSVHRSTPDRETIVDILTQSSEDSIHSGREQSPPTDSLATTVDLQANKKKKRIRKGRNPGPFIEESVKVISKTQNWSSFVKQPSDCSNSSSESVVLEPESMCVDTLSSTTQTDPYEFSLVYKLNSPAFNSFQPVDWTLRGVNVISSSSKAVIHMKLQAAADQACPVVYRKANMASDQSTITDETLEKEELDLETLQTCFPEYSRKQLEATMAICHNDLEWVTSHLLDSPALYDMEDDEEDGPKDEVLKPEEVPAMSRSSGSIKSLADMCTRLVKETNKVDADDLEIQIIQVGEGRLQKIEMFNRYRYRSFSHDDHGGKEYWQDDLLLDDLILTRAKSNFKKRSKLEQQQSISPKTSTFDHELSSQTSSALSVPDNKNPPVSALQDQDSQGLVYPSVFEGTESFSSPLTRVTASEEVNTSTSQSAVIESQPVLPVEFVKHLERLYGPLAIQIDEGGLALDDSTARKIYNCLKLQAAKNVLKGPQDDQLKNDEAMARALQDEENARTSLTTGYASISLQFQAPDRQSTVPGWSGQNPSWMTQTGRGQLAGTGNGSVNISKGSEHFRPHSVADTLNQLRGGKGIRALPHKFQHRKSASVKSVWTGTRRRGQVDSLISIMQEEMAREEQQREQLRFLETTTDMEALATRIKRIELSHLFPSIGPDVLEDIYRSTGYSKEETIRILYQSYNISPVPISQDNEEILNQLRKGHERFEHIEDINDEDTPSEDSESSYEGYRNEAIFCRQLAMDCQQQALRYQSNGMQGAALFYRQRAKKYKEDERLANSRAANVLFDKGSERLQLENTLDLHFYRLDEAINAVNVAIDLKEDEYRKKPDKKNSYLDIVTGWGRNSKNGKAKLKPAIIHHLYAKCFQYEEKSPGMLRVYLSKKL